MNKEVTIPKQRPAAVKPVGLLAIEREDLLQRATMERPLSLRFTEGQARGWLQDIESCMEDLTRAMDYASGSVLVDLLHARDLLWSVADALQDAIDQGDAVY